MLCFSSDKEITQNFTVAPLTVFNVLPHKRYRFRLINAASNVCSFILKIESHKITIVNVDGSAIQPETVETLSFTSGERYDFLVETDQEPRDYSIQAIGYGLCNRFQGVAVLRYGDESSSGDISMDFMDMKSFIKENPEMTVKTFNIPHLNVTNGFPISKVKSLVVDEEIFYAEPDHAFNVFFGTPQIQTPLLFDNDNDIKYMGKQAI